MTLPRLAQLVRAPLASNTALWYDGWIAPEIVAAVVACMGTEWREVTDRGDAARSSRGRRGKKRNCAREVLKHETTWVACDACGKWRRLPPGTAPPPVDARWRCSDNNGDPSRRSCKAPEEPW